MGTCYITLCVFFSLLNLFFSLYTGVESESLLAFDFFLLLAKSDMLMLPMAGTRGLWLRMASKVAVTAP